CADNHGADVVTVERRPAPSHLPPRRPPRPGGLPLRRLAGRRRPVLVADPAARPPGRAGLPLPGRLGLRLLGGPARRPRGGGAGAQQDGARRPLAAWPWTGPLRRRPP